MTLPQEVYREDGKFYTLGSETLPSVGGLCDLLTGGDPFAGVPLASLQKATLEGIGAHQILMQLALDKMAGKELTEEGWPSMPPDYPDTTNVWMEAMERSTRDLIEFFEKHDVEPVGVEQIAVCETIGFAGKPDLLAHLKYRLASSEAVVDLKRVKAVRREHHLKLQAYGMTDSHKRHRLFILHLFPLGGFDLIPVKRDPAVQAALACAAGVLRFQIKGN